jgi:hypothetical protein
VKTEARIAARELRSSGRSVREIAQALAVSRSSVSRWVRDIELAPEHVAALRARNPIYNAQLNGNRVMAARHLGRRRHAQSEGRRLARTGDPFYVAGCMLYWAEGTKIRNSLRFTNSDTAMMSFFVRFLRTYFKTPDERIRVHCNVFAEDELEVRALEHAWLGILGLPDSCLGRSTVNRYSRASRRKRIGLLPYGTCRVTVDDTRVVQTIFGSIQELGGFERAEWLGA